MGWILENQWLATEVIYPFLHSAFGQCVAVTQIIDLYVFDEVSVLLVRLARGSLSVRSRRLDDGRHEGLLCC